MTSALALTGVGLNRILARIAGGCNIVRPRVLAPARSFLAALDERSYRLATVERATRFLAGVDTDESYVLVFAHGDIIRILAAVWLGLPPLASRVFAVDPASISVLGWEEEQRVILKWHLVEASHSGAGWRDFVASVGCCSRAQRI
ncbi:MAG: histidine phosphatase family protein [Acidobacteriia bacterium]|nr:histidine phosphatase family protein [Terriglobia bacterium]